MSDKPYRIFISHAQADAELAKDISQRLKRAGLEVFGDTGEIELGSNFLKQIESALRASDEVWVLLTPNAEASPWTSFETGAALSLEKPVTPIIAGVDAKSPAVTLSGSQPVRYSDLDNAISAVKQRAQSYSSRSALGETKSLRRGSSKGMKFGKH